MNLNDNNMHAIDDIASMLIDKFSEAGWEVAIEDNYVGDFKHIQCACKLGPLEAFTRFDLILMTLNGDPQNVEIRFHFFADPRILGPNKRPFGKKVKVDNFEVLRSVCTTFLQTAGVRAREEETEIAPRSRYKIDFGDGQFMTAAYEVEMVYWKEP